MHSARPTAEPGLACSRTAPSTSCTSAPDERGAGKFSRLFLFSEFGGSVHALVHLRDRPVVFRPGKVVAGLGIAGGEDLAGKSAIGDFRPAGNCAARRSHLGSLAVLVVPVR